MKGRLAVAALVISLAFVAGCDVSINRYIYVRGGPSASPDALRAEAQVVAGVVDAAAVRWGFQPSPAPPVASPNQLRSYHRPVPASDPSYPALVLNVSLEPRADPRRVVVLLYHFNHTREIELMRSVHTDLLRRLVDRFGDQRVTGTDAVLR
jgi:hypothetical protein